MEAWWEGRTCARCGAAFERWPSRSKVDGNAYLCEGCREREIRTPEPPVLDQVREFLEAATSSRYAPRS